MGGTVHFAGFSHSTFVGNSAKEGGGLMLKSSATILSCSLKGNVGKRGGGLRITQVGFFFFFRSPFLIFFLLSDFLFS